jgi:exopolyphosphatase/guanosine-5'-triphosphate,3'-diphosphate pyrophosphatase
LTRVAVVDLGTNSTRLLVADVDGAHVEEVERRLEITRLGEGVDARRRLLPLPIARVRNVLADYRRAIEAHGAEGRTLAIGTSAIRDAENGEAFLGEIEWSYGFTTRLLSGEEEALLTFRGATGGRDLEQPTLVLDVGGGSTELVVGDAHGISFHVSLDMGSVRMTERFADVVQSGNAVRALLAERVPDDARAARMIGVAGTVTTIAAIELGEYDTERVHGHRISRETVERELARLAAMSVDERRAVPGLDPARAEVIVAGIAIVREVLDFFGLDELEASERDIIHGAAIEAAALPEPVEGDAPPGAYTCC